MYTFFDKGNPPESLTLRPEGTAGCVRALVEHNLLRGATPRVWYMGPMFRYEKPQKDVIVSSTSLAWKLSVLRLLILMLN